MADIHQIGLPSASKKTALKQRLNRRQTQLIIELLGKATRDVQARMRKRHTT